MDDHTKEVLNRLIARQRRITDGRELDRKGEDSLNSASTAYVNLVEALIGTNQLSAEQVATIISCAKPVNPVDFAEFTEGFPRETQFALNKAYEHLEEKELDWPVIQERLRVLACRAILREEFRRLAENETRPLETLRSVGAVWCGLFDHGGWLPHWRVPDLRFAYRSPSLFLSQCQKGSAVVKFVFLDEQTTADRFRPPAGIHQAAVVYVCTHGTCPASGYAAYLHKTMWEPGTTRFTAELPIVIVFDTCNLINTPNGWEKEWADTLRGGSVRVLLGFQGLASIDPGSSLRGAALADNLGSSRRMSFADAWIDAVRTNAMTLDSRAVAIGIGGSPGEAESMLHLTWDDTSSTSRPSRLALGPVFFAVKDLYETRVSSTPY